MDSEFEVRAVVTETNGEVSCSIEESNRVRKLLGLKPLRVEEKSSELTAVQNFRLKQANDEKEAKDLDIRKKLEQAKNRRLEKAQLQGKGLSDVSGKVDDDSALLSAADWVKRSRVKTVENAENLKAQKLAQEAASKTGATHTAAELKGLRVKHSAEAFDSMSNIEDGVILTLADSSVVRKDDRGRVLGANDSGDELENLNMREADQRAARDAKVKRLKQPLYGGYDDDEFEETAQFGAMVSSEAAGRKRVLPHYDIDRQEDPNRKKELLVGVEGSLVTQTGLNALTNTASDDADAEAMRGRAAAAAGTAAVSYSLESQKVEIADYYTPAEYSAFNKPKKTKKVKKMRKKEREDEDDSGDFFKQAETMDVVESAAGGASNSAGSSDRGSRKAFVTAGKAESTQSSSGAMESYYKAIASAQEKNERTFSQIKTIVPAEQLELGPPSAVAKPNAANIFVTNTAMQEVKLNSMDTGDAGVYNEGVEAGEEIDADGRRTDGRLIFNDTTEFTSRLRAQLNDKARLKAEVAVKDQERSESAAVAQRVAGAKRAAAEATEASKRVRVEGEDDAMNTEGMMETEEGAFELGMMTEDGWVAASEEDVARVQREAQEAQDAEDDQLAFVHKQPLVHSGMAATLALLKQNNYSAPKEELTGRARDSRVVDPSASTAFAGNDGDRKFDIKLEYRDNKGRKLTQKDAFRQLCYRFHGYGPSERKLEKRAKDVENKQKAKSADLLSSGTMRSLTRTQEATGKAHVVIQGGISNNPNAVAELARSQKMKMSK